MRLIDRFDEYMMFKKLNDNKATIQLGFSVGTIGKSRGEGRDLSKKAVQRILAVYNDLDERWLKTGEGEMICEPRKSRIGLYGKEEEDVKSIPSKSNSSTLDRLVDQIFNNSTTIDKLVDEIAVAHSLIAKSQEQISKSQEQTDRILTLLEIEKGTKTPEDIKKE